MKGINIFKIYNRETKKCITEKVVMDSQGVFWKITDGGKLKLLDREKYHREWRYTEFPFAIGDGHWPAK